MQTTYSQNKEDLFVSQYFGDHKGTLLDVGANDGVTLSNSRLLIEQGWRGHLVEPGEVCERLFYLYKANPNVNIYNYGIGETKETVHFWESGAHVLNGSDRGMVSTADFEETKRWPNVEFNKNEIQLIPFKECYEHIHSRQIDFISIDAEGFDWKILKQINLDNVGCRCLCIEHNSNPEMITIFGLYTARFGMREAVRNGENSIYVK